MPTLHTMLLGILKKIFFCSNDIQVIIIFLVELLKKLQRVMLAIVSEALLADGTCEAQGCTGHTA